MMLFVLLKQIDAQLGQMDKIFDFLLRRCLIVIQTICKLSNKVLAHAQL